MKTVEKILNAVRSESTIAKHIINYTWTSGSSTDVYPIMLWPYYVSLQMDIEKSIFDKAISRVLAAYPGLFKHGCFVRNDGSCPSEIRFTYTEETSRKLASKE